MIISRNQIEVKARVLSSLYSYWLLLQQRCPVTLTEITIPHDEADSEVPRVLRRSAGGQCWPAGVPGPTREHHRGGGW